MWGPGHRTEHIVARARALNQIAMFVPSLKHVASTKDRVFKYWHQSGSNQAFRNLFPHTWLGNTP